MDLRIAGAQLPVTNDIAANVAAIERAIAFAASEGADLLLTPEGSLSGYTPRFDTAAAADALAAVTDRARSVRLALALGTCFVEDDGLCYNQIRFYDAGGEFLGFHSKTLRCGTMTDPPVGEINDYACTPLRTFSIQGVTIGGLICNDMWANPGCTPMPDPHLSHQLSLLGAKVIVHAVNGGRDDSPISVTHGHFHESNLLLRARADRLWIVTADSAHPTTLPTSSPGGVVGPDGSWAVQAPRVGEQFFVHTIRNL